MLTRTPTAAMEIATAVPPKETNGSVMPVIGITPRTPPMFTNAWNVSHVVIPAATMRPKGSGARAATIHPAIAEAAPHPEAQPARAQAPKRTRMALVIEGKTHEVVVEDLEP